MNQEDLKEMNRVLDQHSNLSDNYQDVVSDLKLIFERKNENYGTDNILLGGSIEDEIIRNKAIEGLIFRMSDKMERLKNMILFNKENNFESVEDNLKDLANYSIISIMVLNKKWK